MIYISENKKKYVLKGDVQEAIVIDEDLREFLVERGFVNPTIGDYYVNGSSYRFSIISKDKFERGFVQIEVIEK